MTPEEIIMYLNNKISENEEFIRITFFEMRVKQNLNTRDTEEFVDIAKKILKNSNYKVYVIGEKYWYNGNCYKVEDNELIIAIKPQEINGYGNE